MTNQTAGHLDRSFYVRGEIVRRPFGRGAVADFARTPAELPNEVVPGRLGGPDRAEPLRKDSERAGRDMPVIGRGHHVPDSQDFG